jgi:hypothetical protein
LIISRTSSEFDIYSVLLLWRGYLTSTEAIISEKDIDPIIGDIFPINDGLVISTIDENTTGKGPLFSG